MYFLICKFYFEKEKKKEPLVLLAPWDSKQR